MAMTRDEQIKLYEHMLRRDQQNASNLIRESPSLNKDQKITLLGELLQLVYGDDLDAIRRILKTVSGLS